MGYGDFVLLAMELEGVEESTMYRAPCLRRRGRFMVRLQEDGISIAVKMDWASLARFMAESPEICIPNESFVGYPALLVSLDALSDTLARDLLSASWRDAPNPVRRIPKSP